MVGVVVAAYDGQMYIEGCIEPLLHASRCAQIQGKKVLIVVVLDACRDLTGKITRSLGAKTVAVEVRNVGLAWRMGVQAALNAGGLWLAFTDAESTVAPDWLTAQLPPQSDAVCGVVAGIDCGVYGERMRRYYEASYTDRDGHQHMHGAYLGVSAKALVLAVTDGEASRAGSNHWTPPRLAALRQLESASGLYLLTAAAAQCLA